MINLWRTDAFLLKTYDFCRDFTRADDHFGCGAGCDWNSGHSVGMVESQLDADGRMVLVGDVANVASFYEWFASVRISVRNHSFLIKLLGK